MSSFIVSDAQNRQFHDDGFFLAPALFGADEIKLLGDIARARYRTEQAAASRRDAQGGAIRLAVHNELGDDICSAFVHSRRIVDTMERLLGGEVYHYHHKLILKEPRTGGAWEWHQDYGYWYNNGCLLPLLASCMIAVDRATRENGCLEVPPRLASNGPHRAWQSRRPNGYADQERVQAALARFERVYCELEPGGAIFFDCNLLHCSAQNHSENPRWALICCYNAARNNPYKESRHPRYSHLEKWPDERIVELGHREWQALSL